ncbi:MAG: Ppx/GppA phosphatase family protein [Pseudomonadota bacterium]
MATATDTDSAPRSLEIETDRVLARTRTPFGIVDLGSNSIRLVVYDDLSRAPFARFNEKSMVALGDAIGADGALSEDAMAQARRALRRFHMIARAAGVERVDVLATEATRKASNGRAFLDAIRAETGFEARILTGAEEARFAAMGVLSGFFQPHGLIGDMGGGSLEVAEVHGDAVGNRKKSMPLGALPVLRLLQAGVDTAKAQVDAALADGLPKSIETSTFYAVGGGWRALARVHAARCEHRLSVVHGYEVAGGDLWTLAKKVARMSRGEIAELPDVPGRRVRTLAASSLVMWRVLKTLRPDRVVFSALGVREGWLYSQLDAEDRALDPLLEGAQTIGLPMARVPAFPAALARWTDTLFEDETLQQRRLRLAACALTDIAWRDAQKLRAQETFRRLLHFPFIGIGHDERAFLALAIRARYGGKPDEAALSQIAGLLSDNHIRRAYILGRALLLGHRFSASVPGILSRSRLRIGPKSVVLEVEDEVPAPDSEAVQSRLRQLARAAGLANAELRTVGTSLLL